MNKRFLALGAILAAIALTSVAPVMAADGPATTRPKHEQPVGEFTHVRGTITQIDGKTLTVEVKGGETKTVTYDDKTEIVKDKKVYSDPLKVGDKISAKIKADVAVRIEVQGAKPHKDKPAK